MQFLQKRKSFFVTLIIFVLCFSMLAALTAPAQAAELLPQELYMEQSRGGICTLVSSAMLLRSALYLNGSEHWSEIDESTAANACWLSGAGLLFDWSFQTDYADISVSQTALCGITADELKALLDEHPEGIVFYCGGVPHAVLLTDYEDDVFYCADPAPYCSGSRIPLADSWLGYRLGDQDTILACATAYWAITDCEINDSGLSDVQDAATEAVEIVTSEKEEVREQLGHVKNTIRAMNA